MNSGLFSPERNKFFSIDVNTLRALARISKHPVQAVSLPLQVIIPLLLLLLLFTERK